MTRCLERGPQGLNKFPVLPHVPVQTSLPSLHASPHEFAADPSSHSTVESQRAAQSAVDKARALARDALLAAAAVKAAAAEKQKRRKQSSVDRERA